MKKNIIIGILCTMLGIGYGILIGKYFVFPYRELANAKSFIFNQLRIFSKEITIPETDVSNLISINQKNIDSLKKELTNIIFGHSSLPDSQPDTVYRITDDAYNDLENLDYIEQFEIIQKHNIQSIGYIFHPKISNNRLMFYHQGHVGGFYLGKKTLKQFVKEGFTVYAFSMPLIGTNNQPIVDIDKLGTIQLTRHQQLRYFENPIQYFINPVITMINYSSNKKFDDIAMVGFSGGGWTTTLVAAMDSRINYSFPVSGSIPLFISIKTDNIPVHFEGMYEKLYTKINYLDMYVLGAVGVNRSQTQILTEFDPCCFEGRYSKYYFYEVKYVVDQFNHGKFDIFIDNSHREHKMSETAIMKISEILKSTYKNSE